MAGQPVPYYGHLSNAWVDKEPCTNCRQHMFNMLLIYQRAIQPKAQMLLTANLGEELVTKQPFNHRNLLFLWILGDQLCPSLQTWSMAHTTDGGVQLSPQMSPRQAAGALRSDVRCEGPRARTAGLLLWSCH